MNQFVDECVELLTDAERRLKAEKAAERKERQRLAWLGFYNTAVMCNTITVMGGQSVAPHAVLSTADGMMDEYNERWENDE